MRLAISNSQVSSCVSYAARRIEWSEAEVESLIKGRRKGRSFLELADELGRDAGRCKSRYHHEIRKRNLAKQKRRRLAARGAK